MDACNCILVSNHEHGMQIKLARPGPTCAPNLFTTERNVHLVFFYCKLTTLNPRRTGVNGSTAGEGRGALFVA